jgi:hypothetical protein
VSDITKCPGRYCAVKEQCYRYTAPSNEHWQSWSAYYLAVRAENEPCMNFLPNAAIKNAPKEAP